jgi:hypothetical protein
MPWLFVLDARLGKVVALSGANRVLQPKRFIKIVFRPFASVTFIWASK